MRAVLVAALAVLALGGVATAHESASPSTSATDGDRLGDGSVVTWLDDAVTARAVDRRRGLVYTVESSDLFGSNLYVTFAARTPATVRAEVLHSPLVATCDVPGRAVHEFAGRWNRRFHRYGTALLTDPPVLVARVATTCALYVGREGRMPDTAVFPRRPLSRVRLR